MSKVLVLAESGSGKTASLRHLDPAETAIANADAKPLPIYGWKSKYQTVVTPDGKSIDWTKTNYLERKDPEKILKALQFWEAQPRIYTIVIDTITHMLTDDYIHNAIGKDFKSYQAMAKKFMDVIEQIQKSKKNIVVFGHIKRDLDEMGNVFYDMRLHGKMLAELVPASYFTTVLIGEVNREDKEAPKYLFRTQSKGNDPAKSPAFFAEDSSAKTALEYYEPNDMKVILKKLNDFDEGL